MNWQFASYIISFSDIMCCCWRVSTICDFFICLSANEREVSEWICTNSTRPKPPTPSVDSTRKSLSWTGRNSSLILNGEGLRENGLNTFEVMAFILFEVRRRQVCSHEQITYHPKISLCYKMVSMKIWQNLFLFFFLSLARNALDVSIKDVKIYQLELPLALQRTFIVVFVTNLIQIGYWLIEGVAINHQTGDALFRIRNDVGCS